MDRTQKIAITTFLSALFVSSLYSLYAWSQEGNAFRNLLWDLSFIFPEWVGTPLLGAITIFGFAIPCGIFTWLIARIWSR